VPPPGQLQSPFTAKQRFLLAVIPPLAALLIRALGMTLRYEDVFPKDAVDAIPGDAIPGPTIYAFWHRSLLACAHRFRNKDIAILISRSFDGELIARTVELLGFKAIRGSSSRGGAAGLRGMAEAYAAGHRCAITADGPRGPAQIAKPGTAQLAQLVGAPWVGTFNAIPLNAWELKTWDRFLIPKPFSKVLLTFPHHIPTNAPELQAAIQQSLAQSISMAGLTTNPGTPPLRS
jgi:lysophospholipid acyltransferase (LPLAT)-like uncharacterized protein